MYIQTGIFLLWENQYRPQKFCILLGCNWKLTSFLTFKLSSIRFWVQWVQWKLVLSNTRLLLVTCQLLLVLTSRCIKLLGPLICRLCMCLYVCIHTHTYTHTALVWSNHPAYNDIGLMMVSPCACMRVSLCVCVSMQWGSGAIFLAVCLVSISACKSESGGQQEVKDEKRREEGEGIGSSTS